VCATESIDTITADLTTGVDMTINQIKQTKTSRPILYSAL